MMTIDELRQRADKLTAEYDHACRQLKEEKQALHEAKEESDCALQAQAVIIQLAQSVQQQAHERIASVVTKCLRAVFDEEYTFQINFERKRGRTEAQLKLIQGGHDIDPMEEGSGGVLDVGAFALRLACLMLTKPARRKLVVLDEPFRFVSVENQWKIPALLDTLAEETGMQFIMVTHLPDLACGKIVKLPAQKRKNR